MKLIEYELTTDYEQQLEVLYNKQIYRVNVKIEKELFYPFNYELADFELEAVYDMEGGNEGGEAETPKGELDKNLEAIYEWLSEKVKELT